eukprot:TRINITY_DN50041_c0_g2_i1.p1 TRINITY_DN50041_c0_g2~~TRINITY_DN50041_c0_g2_i1.p1  ORF type:complete len:471 (+),score=18.06 TRINITY_DN50041_c0_g2_i1:48-1460(+)
MSKFDDHDGEEKKNLNFSWMPSGCTALADGEYDAIIMGTGLTECIISGLLSTNGMRVLHVDRNNYYGADAASLSLQNLFQKFRNTEAPSTLGASRDWNVDLIPKFIMACGNLVKILLHTKVTRYLEFKSVDGSYVFKDGKVQKVPATPAEALSSSLMGFFEKRKFRNLLLFIEAYEKDKPQTYLNGKSLDKVTMKEVYDYYGVDENTMSFTGHAMALERDDDYLNRPAEATVDAIKLYAYSIQRYGKSPYIYPLYGLGGLPEGFSRLCAIHGGTFMLSRSVDEVLMKDGKAWGIKCENEIAKAPIIVGDPSYFDDNKTRVSGKVVRSICILDHPINGTDNAESVQIIIPAAQVKGRKNDIYVCMVSFAHMVAANNHYIAIVSTTVETSNPAAEIQPAIALLGNILERFDSISDLREPINDGKNDACYISKSYDATSHFETVADDVLNLYQRITNKELDMTISADLDEDDY